MIIPLRNLVFLFHPHDTASARRSHALRLALAAAVSIALLIVPVHGLYAQSAGDYKEPDYTKFKPEEGQITLEFWSWVGGLDNTVKDFEQAHPNIKIHVNNVGGGPVEYEKLQTALKAGSGAPDVVQIE
jgi:multiple sugar transport system substrate-binding protein